MNHAAGWTFIRDQQGLQSDQIEEQGTASEEHEALDVVGLWPTCTAFLGDVRKDALVEPKVVQALWMKLVTAVLERGCGNYVETNVKFLAVQPSKGGP